MARPPARAQPVRGRRNVFEFHTFEDDVLVVYFRREAKRTIRMVGIYDHDTIPDDE
ncbi:MAG: hypothetical protein ACLRL3_00465 [Bifidobacterium adolescentis]